MGQTLGTWEAQVRHLIADQPSIDATADTIIAVGIRPALSQYSIDRPRTVAADLAPTVSGGRWLPLPSGWVDGWSRVVSIAAPADDDPPSWLDPHEWRIARDPGSVSTLRIMLLHELAAGESARVEFTSPWPMPDNNPATDLLPSTAFDAVSSLAAAMVLTQIAAFAARDRDAAYPTDFADGRDRARELEAIAGRYRIIYNTFIGLGSAGEPAGASARVLKSSRIRSV